MCTSGGRVCPERTSKGRIAAVGGSSFLVRPLADLVVQTATNFLRGPVDGLVHGGRIMTDGNGLHASQTDLDQAPFVVHSLFVAIGVSSSGPAQW